MTQKRPHLRFSTFWNHCCRKIFGTRQGGAKIIVDAQDAQLGAGKTSAAVYLARLFSKAFGYDLQKKDLTLSASAYVDRYREQPGTEQPSVLVLDEAVGAGAGDARRSMSSSNLDLASAWQTMRVKRVVTISTLAHWGDLDKRLKRLADYRLNCRMDPMGHFRPYQVKVDFDNGHPRTKKLDAAIHFPDMSGDPFYEYIDEEKAELLDAATWDADDLEDDDSESERASSGPDVQAIADEILDENELDTYVNINSSNKTEYIDRSLIEIDYDLSRGNAKKVKKLLERARENGATAD